MQPNKKFISLFSGCGGLDAGFIDSGFQCLRAFDIDRSAVEVHNANLGNSAVVSDLRSVGRDQLMAHGTPDVVVAGSPCQGFSTVGRRDVNDPRNSLLLHAGEIAIGLRPRVFLAENVAGALSGDHSVYWATLETMMLSAGYSCTTFRLNASEVGLAQSRSRAFLLAWRGAREPKFGALRSERQTLRTVLAGVDALPDHDPEPLHSHSRHLQIARHIRPGQKLCNVRRGTSVVHTWHIPEVFGQTTAAERQVLEAVLVLRRRDRKRDYGDADPVSITTVSKMIGRSSGTLVRELIAKRYMRRVDDKVDLVNTFNGLYRRLDWSSTSPAVDTKFGNPRFFLHPTTHRGFSVREAARIQGFPDWFTFPATSKQSYRMIGNAVPPPMGKYVARTVKALLAP